MLSEILSIDSTVVTSNGPANKGAMNTSMIALEKLMLNFNALESRGLLND